MSQSPDSGQLRILVVDDEPTLRLGFAYALSHKSSLIETAANGREALEKIAAGCFDILILDLRMPELDGNGVIDLLRAQQIQMPIVLCSAVFAPASVVRAVRHGVVDFLLKPVRPADLRQAIGRIVQPAGDPVSMALKAARSGDFTQAVAILENQQQPDECSECWLGVLRSIGGPDPIAHALSLDEKCCCDLSLLALNRL